MFSHIAKLWKMSFGEMVFRTKMASYRKLDKLTRVVFTDMLTDLSSIQFLDENTFSSTFAISRKHSDLACIERMLLSHMRDSNNLRFFISGQRKSTLVNTLKGHYPNNVYTTQRDADIICEHKFRFFGIHFEYGKEIPWTADPISLREWPMAFYDDIDIFGESSDYGDDKYICELNRHQFFIDLGKAYWLSGDERYSEEFFKLIESWIDCNPYKMGINWTSALEVAVRSISWIWAYHFFLDSQQMSPERNLAILGSLYLHGKYIEKNLSFYFSPYNHLIGEATALFLIGAIFPEFKESSRWTEKGWHILEREVEKQFHSDGGTVEQAASYHHFTLGFYLLAALLKKINSEDIGEKVWRGIEKALDFSMYIMKPDGTIPMIGDNDDAKSIRFNDAPQWDFRSFLSTGAVLFKRGDMKRMAGGFAEDSLWLLGHEGLGEYLSIEPHGPEDKSISLGASGYYVMRDGWDKDANYLCFDCGEQGDGLHTDCTPSAAHGHADFLSFELVAHGRSIIVDPGFYTYRGDRAWHNYFRETSAHNTIVVDGKSQSNPLGIMKWSNVATPCCERWISTHHFDYVRGSHDGYERSGEPMIHRRAIFFKKPEYWVVSDYLDGEGEHLLEVYFHFSPTQLHLHEESQSVFTRNGNNGNILLLPIVPEDTKIEIISEGDLPSSGWIVPAYGCKVRAPILKYSLKTDLPATLITVLYPYKEVMPDIQVHTLDAFIESGARYTPTNSVKGLRIITNKNKDYFLFSVLGGQTIHLDRFDSDAHLAFLRLDKRGEVREASIIEGSFLKVDGKYFVRHGSLIACDSVCSYGDEQRSTRQ